MRLLLVEDDKPLRESISQALKHAGYELDAVADGVAADAALAVREAYAAVVLDLGLPRMGGVEVLHALRGRRDPTPVLILTAMDEVERKVMALDAGADDYLVKPFSIAELEARLRVILRRRYKQPDNVLAFGSLALNTTTRVVTTESGERVELSARDVALFELLLRQTPNWVRKETLIDQLGSWESELSANAVEVAVHRLRKRLEPFRVEIIAVRGLGYMLQEKLA
jgi:two-component system, OmpR family, response regulator